jgi:hypothetical protein
MRARWRNGAAAALLLTLQPVAGATPGAPPDVVLKGAVSRAAHQSYRELPFEVPEAVHRITAAFDYDRDAGTTLDSC